MLEFDDLGRLRIYDKYSDSLVFENCKGIYTVYQDAHDQATRDLLEATDACIEISAKKLPALLRATANLIEKANIRNEGACKWKQYERKT